jgi:pimeloyl-ACP methyl ester carboxylesterase
VHTIYPVTTFDPTITYPSTLYPAPQYTTGTTQQQLDGWAFFTSNVLLHLPEWSNGAGRPPLLACHGRNNTANSAFGANYGSNWGDYIMSLVNAGFAVLAADMGQNSWSNNLALRMLDLGYAYMTALTGATKVGLIGSSMGTNSALQWHRRYPDKVAGTYLISAFSDLDTIRNTGGWTAPYSVAGGDPNAGITYPAPGDATMTASINGAYKCTDDVGWTANGILQGHTPARYPADWRGRYIRLQHAQMDATVPYQSAVWWVNQVNDPKCTLRLVSASTADHLAYTHLAGGTTDAATLAAGGAARTELRDFFYGIM